MGFFSNLFSRPYSAREQRDIPGIGNLIRTTGHFHLCFSCNGLGYKLSVCKHCNEVGSHHGLCNRCDGSGAILFPAIPCPTCDGSGRLLNQNASGALVLDTCQQVRQAARNAMARASTQNFANSAAAAVRSG